MPNRKFAAIMFLVAACSVLNVSAAQANRYALSATIGLGVVSLLAWNPMNLDGVGIEIGDDDAFKQAKLLWLWDMDAPLYQLGPMTLKGHWEFAFGQVDPSPYNIIVGITPVLEWHLQPNYAPYLITGIGLNVFSATEHVNRNFSTHLQFGERLGVGVDIGKVSLFANYQHYSNGNIAKPNNGYNFINTGIKVRY